MTTEQTFKAIFALAAKRGFKFRQPKNWKNFISDPKNHFHIIFSHEFAIALWGQEPACNCAMYPDDRCEYWDYEAWQYHLARMVLESDPYIYLLEKWKQKPMTPHMKEQL
jgi:hypothetical protein